MADALTIELQEVNNGVSESLSKGDFKSVVDGFTEDCVFFAPGRDVITGRKALLDFCPIYTKVNPKSLFTVVEVLRLGDDHVVDRGTYTAYNSAGEKHDEGKYVALRKKIDGKWMTHYDIFNSNKA